ncbi:MAG: PAS domain S-box protein [bacterium]|nr:PAS domain S-box protein [bacterium]
MNFYFEKVKKIRKNKKKRADAIASKLEISRSTLYLWENGKIIPTEKKIRLLAKVLDVSVELISDLKQEIPTSESIHLEEIDHLQGSFGVINMLKLKRNNAFHLNSIKKQFDELTQITSVIEAFLNSIDIIFYAKGISSEYIIANHAFLNNISLDKNFNVFNHKDNDFYSKEEARQNYLEDEQVILNGKTIEKEGYIPGSKKKKWGIISKVPFFDTDGKVAGVVAFFTDITEHKRAESNNELLKKCIDNLPLGVAMFNSTKNKYVYMNGFIAELTELPFLKSIKSAREIYLDALLPEYREKAMKYIVKGVWPKNDEVQIKCKNGSIKWLKFTTAELIEFMNNKFFISFATDITEKKEMECQNTNLNSLLINNDTEKSDLINRYKVAQVLINKKVDINIIIEATDLSKEIINNI